MWFLKPDIIIYSVMLELSVQIEEDRNLRNHKLLHNYRHQIGQSQSAEAGRPDMLTLFNYQYITR